MHGKVFSGTAEKEHAVQGEGTPERYYAELTRQPSFRIELPSGMGEEESSLLENRYQQIYTIPLEYIFLWANFK